MTKKTFIVFILTLFVSCAKQKIIPENTLAEIIYQMNVVDVVLSAREAPFIRDRDSMRIYEPVVEKFGYTLDDLHNTFLKYISVNGKLQSVLKKVVEIIENEKNIYREPARIEKLSENMNVGADSTMIISKSINVQDIDVKLTEQGVYDISASYFFYRNDSTKNPKMTVWLESRTVKDSVIEKQEISLVKDTVFTDYTLRVHFNNPDFSVLKVCWLDFDRESDLKKPKTPASLPATSAGRQIPGQGKKANVKVKPDTATRQHLVIRRKSVKYNFEESDTTRMKEKDMFTGPPPLYEFIGNSNIADSVTNVTDTVKQIMAIKRKDSLSYGI
ncbi:MAG: DUF4296 domain-containing protein [Prevotellaceae bacterium]|jgi:hypothetical protein|nr:DUF4296 domain-containing protein [Prevotellaceae bacterium]